MPTRGYRKGRSDTKAPLTTFVRTRLTDIEAGALTAEAVDRNMTVSKLVRAVLAAHLTRQRAELPQPRGASSAALRELCRIGNNLNQLAKQANTGIVPIGATDLRATLADVLNAVRRLG
jgi:hypothetical protein